MSYLTNKNLNKRGVSVMIGYVLLVAFAVVIGVVTYGWIKTYAPVESIECADGTSIFIKSLTYDEEVNTLSITIKNNGRFNIDGYFIQMKNDSSQGIANIQLFEYLTSGGSVLGNAIINEIRPNQEKTSIFTLSSELGEPISVSATPFQYRTFGNRERLVSCGDAGISQDVGEGTVEFVECGDGGVDAGEECDDGNVVSGDGCSSSCELEFGWQCSGEPSSCEEDGGTYDITDYCQDQGYTTGTCVANNGGCTNQGGELVPGGDPYCTPSLGCCIPAS